MKTHSNANNASQEQQQEENTDIGPSDTMFSGDKAAFFANLDDSVANVEQEDSGLLPPVMSAAPVVTVKSLGKKRRFGMSSLPSCKTASTESQSQQASSSASSTIENTTPMLQPQPPALEDTVPTEVPQNSSPTKHPSIEVSEPIVPKRTKVVHFDLSDSSDSSTPATPVAKDPSKPTPLAIPPTIRSATTSGVSAKTKAPVKTVASSISRRKPIAPASRPSRHTQNSSSSTSNTASISANSSRSSRKTRKAVPLRPTNTANIILLESDSESEQDYGQGTSTDTQATTRKVFEGLRVYVVPTSIDSMYYELLRERLMAYGGQWLGPLTKPKPKRVGVASDRPEPPTVPLQPDITTHVVSALRTRAAVCAALHVDAIEPKIEVVDRSWLSDSLELRMPLETSRFLIPDNLPEHPSQTKEPPPEEVVKSSKKNMRYRPKPPDSPPRRDQMADSDDEHMAAGEESLEDIIEEVRSGSMELEHLSLDDSDMEDADGTDGHDEEEDEVIADQGERDDKEQDGREKGAQELPSSSEADKKMIQGSKSTLQDGALLNFIDAGKRAARYRTKPKYRCQEPHTGKEEYKYNRRILEQLEEILHYYERTEQKGSKDKWRVVGYRKAITAIRALDFDLTSEVMAARIQGIGPRIAKKIGECIAVGRISKLNFLGSEYSAEQLQVDNLFRNIYGVGAQQAAQWYKQGLRTLEDVRQLSNLTQNQQVGLKHYDDLLKRIPRAEVEEIGEVVRKVALELHPDIECEVTGSYRRGSPDCGDVDMVISRPGVDLGSETFPIMNHIIERLTEMEFLTDHLSLPVWTDDMQNQFKHFKYMGVCKLSGANRIHHHIDILVVPARDRGSTLIYFTGNDVFNRSIRQLAFRRGMHLSDKGLWDRVIRGKKRNIIDRGIWVAGHTEKDVFDYLKIDWLEPHERNC